VLLTFVAPNILTSTYERVFSVLTTKGLPVPHYIPGAKATMRQRSGATLGAFLLHTAAEALELLR
jgi:hypothetical protein